MKKEIGEVLRAGNARPYILQIYKRGAINAFQNKAERGYGSSVTLAPSREGKGF